VNEVNPHLQLQQKAIQVGTHLRSLTLQPTFLGIPEWIVVWVNKEESWFQTDKPDLVGVKILAWMEVKDLIGHAISESYFLTTET
jgi:hypothetical protein